MIRFYLFFLCLCILEISYSQNSLKLEVGLKSGVATIYNSTITRVGYVHDYRLGSAHAANITLRKNWKKNVLSIGSQFQFTSVKYRNFSLPNYLDTNSTVMDYVNYTNRMFQLQVMFGFHRRLPLGIEIGVSLSPTFLCASHENFKTNYLNQYEGYQYNVTTKNNPAYNRFVLLGSLEIAKVQTLKSGKTLRYTLSPTISLSNPGGVNSYGVAMSPKGNFSSFYVNAQAGIAYQFR
jgi:hypothetical protein